MADLQYQGDGAEDDPTVKVANAMRKMDGTSGPSTLESPPTRTRPVVELTRLPYARPFAFTVSTIQAFRFPEPNEDFDELRILPPPVFSRLTLPQIYECVRLPVRPAAVHALTCSCVDSLAIDRILSPSRRPRPTRMARRSRVSSTRPNIRAIG